MHRPVAVIVRRLTSRSAGLQPRFKYTKLVPMGTGLFLVKRFKFLFTVCHQCWTLEGSDYVGGEIVFIRVRTYGKVDTTIGYVAVCCRNSARRSLSTAAVCCRKSARRSLSTAVFMRWVATGTVRALLPGCTVQDLLRMIPHASHLLFLIDMGPGSQVGWRNARRRGLRE